MEVGVVIPDGADTQRLNNAEEEAPPPNNGQQHHLDLDVTLPAFFKGLPAVDLVQVLSFVVKMEHNKLTAIAYLMSFILSYCLHAVVISECIEAVNNRRHVKGFIAYLSVVLRMLGAAALLLFLDDYGGGVHSVAMLAPFLLLLVLVGALSWWTFLTGEVVGVNWAELNEDLKLRFDLSVNVVYMAFAGLAGRVNNGGTGSAGIMTQAPDYLLFYGVVLGLLHVLLCTVPVRVPFRRTRVRVAKVYMPLLAYVALLLVVLASVVAAQGLDILWINVFFGLFAIIVFVVIVFSWRNYRACATTVHCLPVVEAAQIAQREQDANLCKYLVLCYFMPLFALVMSTHSKYGIHGASTVSLPWWFMFFLFSGLCSILAYAARSVVFAEMRDDDRDRDRWVPCTTHAMYGTIAITVISSVLALALRYGEIKNILVR
ncbi:hypothetical protein U9M48_034650 [Paspalum notatum var. saurae]|uniref:Uncharacterized protein n=1 Tax=Paspalum notatum var. saurae TaxID=547442 RepID=A0AAQ3UDX5_PASNO